MKKIIIFIAMMIILSFGAMAVECDTTLSIVPCNVTSDLTLVPGNYDLGNYSLYNGYNNNIYPSPVAIFDGVTFDGSGSNITYTVTSGANVFINGFNVTNVEVKNFNLVNEGSFMLTYGVYFQGGDNITISNVTTLDEEMAIIGINDQTNKLSEPISYDYVDDVLIENIEGTGTFDLWGLNITLRNINLSGTGSIWTYESDFPIKPSQFYFENVTLTGLGWGNIGLDIEGIDYSFKNCNLQTPYYMEPLYGEMSFIFSNDNVEVVFPSGLYDNSLDIGWDGNDPLLSNDVVLGNLSVGIFSSIFDNPLNVSANITFFNLPVNPSNYVVQKDGVTQTEGVDYTLISNDSSSMIIEVPGFSTWSLLGGSPNDNPIVSNVTVYPQYPNINKKIDGFCLANDTENDTINYNYRWYKNDTLLSEGKVDYIINSSFTLNTTWKNGITDTSENHPALFYDNGLKLILGITSGTLKGYEWNGTGWSENSSLVNGITTTLLRTKPHIFNYNNQTILLLNSQTASSRISYVWNGTQWNLDNSWVTGLTTISYASYTTFEDNGVLKLIAGSGTGETILGYEWNGTQWNANSLVVNGVSFVNQRKTPMVYNAGNRFELIIGGSDGKFYSYYYNGESWVIDNNIKLGLSTDIGWTSAPSSIIYNNEQIFISGELNTGIYAYNRPISELTNNGEVLVNTISNTFTNNESEFIFSCQAYDSYGTSEWVNSSISYVGNQIPSGEAKILPIDVFTYHNLNPYCNFTDLNNDLLTYYNVSWYNGSELYKNYFYDYWTPNLINSSSFISRQFSANPLRDTDLLETSNNKIAVSYYNVITNQSMISICNLDGTSCVANNIRPSPTETFYAIEEFNNSLYLGGQNWLFKCDLNAQNCTNQTLPNSTSSISMDKNDENLLIFKNGGILTLCDSEFNCSEKIVATTTNYPSVNVLNNRNIALVYGKSSTLGYAGDGFGAIKICDSNGENCSSEKLVTDFKVNMLDSIVLKNGSIAIASFKYISSTTPGRGDALILNICDSNGENCNSQTALTGQVGNNGDYDGITMLEMADGRIAIGYQTPSLNNNGRVTIYDGNEFYTSQSTSANTYASSLLETSNFQLVFSSSHSTGLMTFISDNNFNSNTEYKFPTIYNYETNIDENWTIKCEVSDSFSTSSINTSVIIKGLEVNLLNPQLNDIYLNNDSVIVEWTTNLEADVQIDYYNGTDWENIKNITNTTSTTVDLSNEVSTENAQIRLIAFDGENYANDTSGTFTVDNVQFSLDYPVGGDNFDYIIQIANTNQINLYDSNFNFIRNVTTDYTPVDIKSDNDNIYIASYSRVYKYDYDLNLISNSISLSGGYGGIERISLNNTHIFLTSARYWYELDKATLTPYADFYPQSVVYPSVVSQYLYRDVHYYYLIDNYPGNNRLGMVLDGYGYWSENIYGSAEITDMTIDDDYIILTTSNGNLLTYHLLSKNPTLTLAEYIDTGVTLDSSIYSDNEYIYLITDDTLRKYNSDNLSNYISSPNVTAITNGHILSDNNYIYVYADIDGSSSYIYKYNKNDLTLIDQSVSISNFGLGTGILLLESTRETFFNNASVPVTISVTNNIGDAIADIDYWNGTAWVNTHTDYNLSSGTPTIDFSSIDIADAQVRANINDDYVSSGYLTTGNFTVISNTAPNTPTVYTIPTTSVILGEDIVGYCQVNDLDVTDENTVYYEWKNGVTVLYSGTIAGTYTDGEIANYTLTGNLTSADQNISFACRTNDGYEYSSWAETDGVYIINPIPVINSVIINNDIITVTTTPHGVCNATDLNNAELYYSYKWYVNDIETENGTSGLISGNLLNDFTGELSLSDELIFSCFASDGVLESVSWVNSSLKVVTENTAPTYINSYIPAVTDIGTLTAYCEGYDANEDSLSFDWILYRNDIEFSNGTTTGGVSNVYKLLTNVEDDLTNLITGDEWIVSCAVSDGINTTDYTNSSITTVTKENVPATISDVKMYPILLMNDSVVSATANGSDVNFDNLNYSFNLYESPVEIQELVVDNFTDGLIFESESGDPIVETGLNYPLWTYSASSSRTYPTVIQESNGVLSLVARLDSPITYSLNGAYSQQNYEIKNNNVNISFDASVLHTQNNLLVDSWINVGNNRLKTFPGGYLDTGYKHYDLLYDSETKIVELYEDSILVGSANLTNSDNNYLTFHLTNGRTFYPSIFNIKNLNATKSVASNYAIVETKNILEIQSEEVSVDFTYTPLDNYYYKVGVFANDSDSISDELFSYEFLSRDTNFAPISTASTNPSQFVGVDDNIEGYCQVLDGDGDTIEYHYKWYVNNVEVKSGSLTNDSYFKFIGGTTQLLDTLNSSYTSVADTVIFSCAGSDELITGDYNNVSQYIYSENNFAPSMQSLNLDIESNNISATEPSNVSFITYGSAIDLDGDTVRYEWRFVKNGILQSITTTDYVTQGEVVDFGNLSESLTSVGDVWYIQARAYDGVTYSSWANSNSVTIINTLPEITSDSIVGTPTENATLTASCSATDIDIQTLTFEYNWYKDGVLTTTGNNLPFNYTQVGQEWILGCRVNDSVGYTSWTNSTPITILDSSNIATIQSVSIQSSGNNLNGLCLANDLDGDTLNISYIWYKNNVEFSSGSGLNSQGTTHSNTLVDTITEGTSYIYSCKAIDTDSSTSYVNSTAFSIPTISFNYNVEDLGISYIKIDWTTDSDSVYVYVDDILRTTSTGISYTIESLTPDTQYEIKLVPFKANYYGTARVFNVTTIATDNNPPVMQNVFITPSLAYTNNALTGTCNANDVESQNIVYTYTWKVNNITISSGTTIDKPRNTNTVIGSITSSNFVSGDNITLECFAYDGISSSNVSSYNMTISNSEPDVEVAIIVIDGSEFSCENSYTDLDSDVEINQTYEWYVNGNLTGYTDMSVTATNFNVADELICTVHTGDLYNNITLNTSVFIVGDFSSPTITNMVVPEKVYTDSSYVLSVKCEDENNIATGYPRVRFINPNFQEEEYQLYYEGNNVYQRYHTFPVTGTYTNFEFECKDGNNNQEVSEYSGTLLSLARETIINIGGSGGGGTTTEEEFRDIVSFSVTPLVQEVSVPIGSTEIIEFEVKNDDIVDIDFVASITLTSDTNTYEWMSFEGGLKTTTFVITKESGLGSSNKYVRYYVAIPSDVEPGEYLGEIEITGLDQTETYKVTINVVSGTFTGFADFLSYNLFNLPALQVTGNAVAVEGTTTENEPIPVKIWHLLVFISGIGALAFLWWKIKG